MTAKSKIAAGVSGTERALRALLRRLAGTCRDPAHMIELYYWSEESELIGILRRYITLPDEPRDALRAFLAMTADCPETVQVTVSPDGHVTLSSPAVTAVMLESAPLQPENDRSEAVH
jgi:hypothetical protein